MHSKISKKRRTRARSKSYKLLGKKHRSKSYKLLGKKHRSSKKVHHKRVKSRRRKRIMRPSRRPSRRYHALRKRKTRKQKGGATTAFSGTMEVKRPSIFGDRWRALHG